MQKKIKVLVVSEVPEIFEVSAFIPNKYGYVDKAKMFVILSDYYPNGDIDEISDQEEVEIDLTYFSTATQDGELVSTFKGYFTKKLGYRCFYIKLVINNIEFYLRADPVWKEVRKCSNSEMQIGILLEDYDDRYNFADFELYPFSTRYG